MNVGISKLTGIIRTTGCHAGGIIISSKILKNYFPLMKSQGGSAILPMIQLEMNDLEFFNLLKLDALGLQTLDQLKNTVDLIKDFDYKWFDSEDFDDPKVYEHLRNGNTVNVFQMQKPQATRLLKDFMVSDFVGIATASAGVRPGLSSPTEVYNNKAPTEIYSEIKKGLRKRDFYGSAIDGILDKTNGIIWYQEDCQMIGQEMAGYTLGGSDTRIRKTLGKKKLKEIPVIRNEFIYGKESLYDDKHENVIGVSEVNSKLCVGAINNGYSEEIAKKIFKLIEAMAKYAFNLSHKMCGTIQ